MIFYNAIEERGRIDAMTDGQPRAIGAPARRFLEAVVSGDARSAAGVVTDAMRGEPSLAALYHEVFAPALDRVGRLWAAGRLTVAQEHLATQVTLDEMARVRQAARPARKTGLAAVVAAIEGEEHWVGARMVADLLEEAGWSVDFLGPNTPVADLVAHVAGRRPVHLVVMSVTMDTHLPALGRLSPALRALPSPPKLVVGGRAAEQQPVLAVELGADAVATDVADTVVVARRLVPTVSRPNPPLDRVLPRSVGTCWSFGPPGAGASRRSRPRPGSIGRTSAPSSAGGRT
jgi:methanogenic corrinoid protein MtbC1